jgi:hypothetical protein
MPRQARKESGTGIYHVMLRGINRQDIFEDAEDYMRMLKEDIGSTIKHLAVMYAMYYNQKYSRSGHVFQDTSIPVG